MTNATNAPKEDPFSRHSDKQKQTRRVLFSIIEDSFVILDFSLF